jgi:hypothetical protein
MKGAALHFPTAPVGRACRARIFLRALLADGSSLDAPGEAGQAALEEHSKSEND